MTDFVDETLRYWRETTFEFGQRDCLLSVADYMTACGGNGFHERLKGTYSTEDEALALMAAHGGPTWLGDQMGLPRTDTPVRGDAVVIQAGPDGIGGICTGEGVAFRRPEGVAEINIRFLHITEAWRCGGN